MKIQSNFLAFSRCKIYFLALLVCILLGVTNSAYADTISRDINDWLSAQGSIPRVTIGSVTIHKTNGWSPADSSLFYLVDSFGVLAKDLSLPPPTIVGKVTQRSLNDGTGRAEVIVDLHTTNAIIFVTDFSKFASNPAACTFSSFTYPAFCPTFFGYGVSELISSPKLAPILGESFIRIKFINNSDAPNALLPDAYKLLVRPDLLLPGQQLESAGITASNFGPLRAAFGVADGTPGKAQTVQVEIDNAPGIPNQGIPDGFPVENVSLQVVGAGTAH